MILIVNGLDEVDLRSRFLGLSALEDARGEAVNGAMIQRRAEEDVALAVRLLRSEGYYDGVATSAIEQLHGEEGQPARLRVTITAAPGQRYRFGDIAIVGPETVPPGLAREALRLESGAPIVAADVESAEANVLLRLPQQGYPFAELGLRDIELDPQTLLGAYTLPLETGPRASFRRITSEGTLAFDVEHVGVLSRFRSGSALRPPPGRRSARSDGLDPVVPHRLGRTGAAIRADHPVCFVENRRLYGKRHGAWDREPLAPGVARVVQRGRRRHRRHLGPDGAGGDDGGRAARPATSPSS